MRVKLPVSKIESSGFIFTARGRTVIDEGFKAVERKFRDHFKVRDETDEDEPAVMPLSEGQKIDSAAAEITEHWTQPPKHYTEDTLLSAMERAGTDEITEEVERSGLGTPATRAAIIEKLTKSGFVKRSKKNLVVSEGGNDIVSLMPEMVKSASMTAKWENALSQMAQGKYTPQQFMADIEKLTSEIIETAKNNVDENKVTGFRGEIIGTCPRCGRNIVIAPKSYSCESKACGFTIWKNNKFFENARKELTDDMVRKLLAKGKIAVSGLYSQKSGKTYDAVISLDDTGKYVNFKLEFPPRKAEKKK